MRSNYIIILLSIIFLPEDIFGDIRENLLESENGIWHIASESYTNPAINQWRLNNSMTSLKLSGQNRSDSSDPDPRNGSDERNYDFSASTFTCYKTSRLWGEARYSRKELKNVVWNETSDSELLYPYLMADSVGGTLDGESYSFTGGYGDHSNRWAWGGEISYTADLCYRTLDPRPRNISGKFELKAGLLYRFHKEYYAGLGLSYFKYKQSNDIMFKNELGQEKIFHLTGMGNHYTRFDGTGLNTFYNGYDTGISFNIYPTGTRGIFASCAINRFTFKNILSDLNKLPLATVNHKELKASIGWRGSTKKLDTGGEIDFNIYRRHGSENQFGDAASAIYPLIGSNEMYADNCVKIRINGRCNIKFNSTDALFFRIASGYENRTEAYIEPYSYRTLSSTFVDVGIAGSKGFEKKWLLQANMGLIATYPLSNDKRIISPDNGLAALNGIEEEVFLTESRKSHFINIGAAVTHVFNSRLAISLRGEYSRRYMINDYQTNRQNITLSLIF